MDKISLMVATPAYGGQIYVGYLKTIINLERELTKHNIEIHYEYCVNESLIPRARNYLTDRFLKTNCTHLLFLDGDIQVDPLYILELIKADKEVIGGIYPKKSIDWKRISEFINNNKNIEYDENILKVLGRDPVTIVLDNDDMYKNSDPIIETRYTGTGIFLIKREVLSKMIEAYPDDKYNSAGNMYHKFFDTEIKYGVYLSEDYYFCERWRNLGGKVYLYKNMSSKHWGTYFFE